LLKGGQTLVSTAPRLGRAIIALAWSRPARLEQPIPLSGSKRVAEGRVPAKLNLGLAVVAHLARGTLPHLAVLFA
jgi:hypothetical protein